jgi:hypothetical protein
MSKGNRGIGGIAKNRRNCQTLPALKSRTPFLAIFGNRGNSGNPIRGLSFAMRLV